MKKILAMLILALVVRTPAAAEDTYIETAFSDGVILGDESGSFHPEKTATRAEFAVMLTRFLNLSGGVNPFSDVSHTDWYEAAVTAAASHGILSGDDEGNVHPNEPLTRQDAVTVLGRFYDAKSSNYISVQGADDYAKEYVTYALRNGFISGAPKDAVTKGEILRLMYEYDKRAGTALRFSARYPRIAKSASFGSISVVVKTNKPCKIYYELTEANTPPKGEYTEACTLLYDAKTIKIGANLNKSYDLYLKAEENGRTGRGAVLRGVQPFAIASGDGTLASPYVVYTYRQLTELKDRPYAHYVLGADITAESGWKPIDDFSGSLDGKGYKISGISVDAESGAGLFAQLSGEVKNLLVSAEVNAKKNAGVIAGINKGAISSCTAVGSVSSKTDAAGGICGKNMGEIVNCLSAVYSVSSGSFAGGICGQNLAVIQNSLSAAEVVAADMYAGAVAGVNDSGEISATVSACMSVYDMLTINSERVTTNRDGGRTKNNFCYSAMNTNAASSIPDKNSDSGGDISWNEICSEEFYKSLGWSMEEWKTPENGYELICPEGAAEPELIRGKTAYFPKPVSTERELREIDKNPTSHYILKNDIILTAPWKTICRKDGFSGTLDGDGHTIYALNLTTETGMFSNITGGTVKNLTLRGVKSSLGSSGGILTACNYGYIENCRIYGEITTKKAGYIGTFAGENHGAIDSSVAAVNIKSGTGNVTIGGIAAENSGRIWQCEFSGNITVNSENAVIGGICGYDTAGNVFESFANVTVSAKIQSGYVGGAVGIAQGTQGYKVASSGRIVCDIENVGYVGGVLALLEEGVIYSAYSTIELHTSAASGYAGGIAALSAGSNIQNTYSVGNIVSVGKIKTGGICGFSQMSFIMQNVSLNPAINSGGSAGAVVGESEMSETGDNYCADKMLINSLRGGTNANNGTAKALSILKNPEFYFNPVADGGALGWSREEWESIKGYDFLILSGVGGQENIKNPIYK